MVHGKSLLVERMLGVEMCSTNIGNYAGTSHSTSNVKKEVDLLKTPDNNTNNNKLSRESMEKYTVNI